MPSKYKPRNRKVRPIILPIGPSIAYVPLTQEQFSLIDSWDATRVGERNWHAKWEKKSGHFYAGTNIRKKNGVGYKTPSLQEFILGRRNSYTVDHKEPGNGLDNRECNLRHCNIEQQRRNRRMQRSNTSGYRGVYLYKKNRKWTAKIHYKGKLRNLGYFGTPEEAYSVYCAASKKYYGEFGRRE